MPDSPPRARYRVWQRGSFFRDPLWTHVFSWVMGSLAAPIYRWALAEMQPDLARAERILDVGCGNFVLAAHAAAMGVEARSWTGVDQSPAQLRAGRIHRRRAARRLDTSAIAGTAEALPFRDGCFDAVVTTGSINLWQPPTAGLAECARVLAPGGVLWLFDQAPVRGIREAGSALLRQRVFGLGFPGYSCDQIEAFALAADLGPPDRRIEDGSLYGLRWYKAGA